MLNDILLYYCCRICVTDGCPYLTLDDANKLDDVRLALRRGDLKAAALGPYLSAMRWNLVNTWKGL